MVGSAGSMSCCNNTMEIPENSSSAPSHPGHWDPELQDQPNKYQRWNIFLHSWKIQHFNRRYCGGYDCKTNYYIMRVTEIIFLVETVRARANWLIVTADQRMGEASSRVRIPSQFFGLTAHFIGSREM